VIPSVGGRLSRIDVRSLDPPPRLILNPRAGQKFGLATNVAGADAVRAALDNNGIRCELHETEGPRHASDLARQAVRDGCQIVIAAGGDGTVAEVGEGLVGSDSILGVLPLGSIMNMARTLCVPRDLDQAAQTLLGGQVLAMDVGRVNGSYFLEAGGVGLAAGLFAYFDRLDQEGPRRGLVRGLLRFLGGLGTPRLTIDVDGELLVERAPMVTVANAPYVGAAYVLAPEARIDDGLLEVVIFRELGVFRVLVHMLLVAGGRRLPPPPEARVVRGRSIRIARRRGRRQLPLHADGSVVGATPAHFEVVPAALRVVVGEPQPGAACAWGGIPRTTESTR
jgi:diacylglycerol kinase (ATP)